MRIYLNGELVPTHCQNLLELVEQFGLDKKRFAIEHNSRIITKSRLEETTLSEYDRIEIINAVGGG
ncbi:thiamine biosynthesis protein ThiS [Acinetobacter baumannii 532279]|uniref:sulfur carrier protein ThiS n=1 Tax=Acinetobacter baumannii TaxID=470 RepID=UPI000451F3A6|nr:sulfur carrier protein ThiS [Acinetobacter baumannii]EXE88952.1 thiamine biosynthesis protein ThiS [Acinetobacter baumannii 532279]